jgi:vancomycin resistance protein VanW
LNGSSILPVGFALTACAAIVLGIPREHVIAGFSTSVAERTPSQRHNARLALNLLKGVTVGPGEMFSFNDRVGSFSRDRGFRRAPVSYNGELVDDWGGGVCQTSTTLYNAALLAGMDIVERHRHQFAPSYAPAGRDAAVAFSNIDLRFRNPYDFPIRIEGEIGSQFLQITILGGVIPKEMPRVMSDVTSRTEPRTVRISSPKGKKQVWVRNTGKMGMQVSVYRIYPSHRELVSQDSYPAMDRVEESR